MVDGFDTKKRILLLLIVIVSCFLVVLAAEGDVDSTFWNLIPDLSSGTQAELAYGVEDDSNGFVYVVGFATDLEGAGSQEDWMIKKHYVNGTELNTSFGWNKSVNSGTGNDTAFAVAVDSNNNVYVVGFGEGINGTSTGWDWWLKKYNTSGVERNKTAGWNKTFDAGRGNDGATDIFIDGNDNVFVVGFGFNLTHNDSQSDWWIKKFDVRGNENITHWNHSFDGARDNDTAQAVTVDSNGGVYVVGSGYNVYNSTSRRDWWIKKFNINGTENTTHWNLTFDHVGQDDEAYDVAVDSNNNVYVVGYGTDLISSSSNRDWWIKKFYTNGTEQNDSLGWNKTVSGVGNIAEHSDIPYSVEVDLNDNVYVVGVQGYRTSVSAAGWLHKYNSSGHFFNVSQGWNKTIDGSGLDSALEFGGDESFQDILVDSGNNITVVGGGNNISGVARYHWWIRKYEGEPENVDTTEPTVVILNPANNSNLSRGLQAFNASVIDATAVDDVIFMFETNTTAFNLTATNVSGDWNANANISAIVEGLQRVRVFANDTLGNVNRAEVVWVRVDRTPPNVTLVTASSSTTDTTPDIVFNFTDNSLAANCSLYANYTFQTSAVVPNATDYTLTVQSALEIADHPIWVNCTDYSANQGNSSNITLTITQAPAEDTGSSGGSSSGGGSGGGGFSSCAEGYTRINGICVADAVEEGSDDTQGDGTTGSSVSGSTGVRSSGVRCAAGFVRVDGVCVRESEETKEELPANLVGGAISTGGPLRPWYINWFWLIVVSIIFLAASAKHFFARKIYGKRKALEDEFSQNGLILKR